MNRAQEVIKLCEEDVYSDLTREEQVLMNGYYNGGEDSAGMQDTEKRSIVDSLVAKGMAKWMSQRGPSPFHDPYKLTSSGMKAGKEIADRAV